MGCTELDPWFSEVETTEEVRGQGAEDTCKGVRIMTDLVIKAK